MDLDRNGQKFPRTFKMWGSTAEFGKNSLRCVFDKYLSNCTSVGTYVQMESILSSL